MPDQIDLKMKALESKYVNFFLTDFFGPRRIKSGPFRVGPVE